MFGFVHGVQVSEGSKLLFISGQLGITSDGKVIEEGFEAQCNMAFDSIGEVLKKAGGSFHNIVKIT